MKCLLLVCCTKLAHLVLYAHFSEQAKQTAMLAKKHNLLMQEAERELMGCHYGEIGAILMAKWQLPCELQMLTHHKPFPLEAGEDLQLTTLMHVAHIDGQNISDDQILEVDALVSDDLLTTLGILRGELALDIDNAESMSQEMAEVILL